MVNLAKRGNSLNNKTKNREREKATKLISIKPSLFVCLCLYLSLYSNQTSIIYMLLKILNKFEVISI